MSSFVVVSMGRVSLQLRIREVGRQERKGEGNGRGAVGENDEREEGEGRERKQWGKMTQCWSILTSCYLACFSISPLVIKVSWRWAEIQCTFREEGAKRISKAFRSLSLQLATMGWGEILSKVPVTEFTEISTRQDLNSYFIEEHQKPQGEYHIL